MTKYDIPLRVKLSKKEYNKIKYVPNKSKYVRNAINFYNNESTREIELSKKKMLEEIMLKIRTEHERFHKKLINNELLKEENIMSTLTNLCDECDEELKRLEEEDETCRKNSKKFDKDVEEKILNILPTLQGMYHSELGLTYNSKERIAESIDISVNDLQDWINRNHELIKKTDFLNRTRICGSVTSKEHDYKNNK